MSTWTDFHVNWLHDVEIEFIVLDLAFQNQIYYTQDASFLNNFKNVLTN